MKLGRNEPCWCGSGMKFKKCHLDRDKQAPICQGEIQKQLNNFYANKVCSVPEPSKSQCSKKIIKAHSVSKSSSLKEIAIDGHVLTIFKASRASNSALEFEPKKIGINNASTFTGFCSFHDKNIFSPIENEEFKVTKANCFLVSYRAVAREAFVKEAVGPNF